MCDVDPFSEWPKTKSERILNDLEQDKEDFRNELETYTIEGEK